MNHLSPLLVLFLALPVLAAGQSQDLFLDLDLEAARARAEQTDLLLLIELEAPDEELTRAFDELVWTDAEATRWVEVEAIAVRYSGAESDRLAALWGVEERPVILLQEPDGLELRRISPPVTAKKFVRNMRLTVSNRAVLSAAAHALMAAPEDLRVRLAYAQALLDAHLFAAALVEFDVLWESGRGDLGFREDRLGLMVRTVYGMTGTYPKARGTLNRWRKQAVAVLSQPPEATDLEVLKQAAAELGAINVRMDDTDHSLEMYRKLGLEPAMPEEVLTVLFDRHVFQIFYNQKRFDELLAGCGDVLLRVEDGFAMYERFLARKRSGELPIDEYSFVDALRNSATVRGARYYETLLMTGNLEEAVELSELVCNRLPRGETYLSLMAAAKRSRATDELRRLGENGIARLTVQKDVEMVRAVHDKNFAKQLPKDD